jgi:hypothetical protein
MHQIGWLGARKILETLIHSTKYAEQVNNKARSTWD